jgi:hypothetical protein
MVVQMHARNKLNHASVAWPEFVTLEDFCSTKLVMFINDNM